MGTLLRSHKTKENKHNIAKERVGIVMLLGWFLVLIYI